MGRGVTAEPADVLPGTQYAALSVVEHRRAIYTRGRGPLTWCSRWISCSTTQANPAPLGVAMPTTVAATRALYAGVCLLQRRA
jgi:hypothetical protein